MNEIDCVKDENGKVKWFIVGKEGLYDTKEEAVEAYVLEER